MNFRNHNLQRLLLGVALAVSAGEAMAALGTAPSIPPAASPSSPVSGARALSAASSTQSTVYTRHEVQLENGTTVREFVTPEGLVFAVAWRGPVLPDLQALLGNYFKTFKAETEQARTMGRRGSPVSIERDGLIIRSSGRMRNFFGYAYAPSLVPAGVNISDVLQ
jgi:hypothetical protein